MNFNNLSGFVPLDLASEILSLIETQNFPKNHLLHKQGTVCKHIYLVQKGIVNGGYKKIIKMF